MQGSRLNLSGWRFSRTDLYSFFPREFACLSILPYCLPRSFSRGFVAVGAAASASPERRRLCLTWSAVAAPRSRPWRALRRRSPGRGHLFGASPRRRRLFRSADRRRAATQDGQQPYCRSQGAGHVTISVSPPSGSSRNSASFQQRHPRSDDAGGGQQQIPIDLKGEGVDQPSTCDQPAAPARNLFGVVLAPVAYPPWATASGFARGPVRANCLVERYDDPRRLAAVERMAGQPGTGGGLKPRAVLRFNHYDQVIPGRRGRPGGGPGPAQTPRPLLADGRLRC